MRAFLIAIVTGVAVSASALAGELKYTATGGDSLKVAVANASQQEWKIFDDKLIVVAAVVNGELVVEKFKWELTPSPDPRPQPTPDPVPPRPVPDLAMLVWIEESSQRDANQAAALVDAELRNLLTQKRIAFRVVDVDVVDENGRTPTDLAPLIAAAKQKGLPVVFGIDSAGRTVLEAKVTDKASFEAIVRRITGTGQPEQKQESKQDAAKLETQEAEPGSSVSSTQTCPTGQCPTYQPRYRVFRR